MSDHLAIKLPFERGQQLRDLAAANGIAITDAVGLLLDHGARTGLDVTGMLGIGAVYDLAAAEVHIQFNGFTLTLTPTDARTVAKSLRAVATRGAAHLDMDLPEMVEITRSGVAVVITIHGEHGAVVVRRTISRGVARAVADSLDDFAGMAEHMDQAAAALKDKDVAKLPCDLA